MDIDQGENPIRREWSTLSDQERIAAIWEKLEEAAQAAILQIKVRNSGREPLPGSQDADQKESLQKLLNQEPPIFSRDENTGLLIKQIVTSAPHLNLEPIAQLSSEIKVSHGPLTFTDSPSEKVPYRHVTKISFLPSQVRPPSSESRPKVVDKVAYTENVTTEGDKLILPNAKGKHIHIGRQSDKGVSLDIVTPKEDVSVSRLHADITMIQDGIYEITDKSTYGTFINGLMIPKDQARRLQEGDQIKLGRESTLFRFGRLANGRCFLVKEK